VMSPEPVPGVVLIEVRGQRHYWQYEVQPEAGSVRLVKEQDLKGDSSGDAPETFQQPAGAIQGCNEMPQATSPDGRYVAQCKVLLRRDHSPLRDLFVLSEGGSTSSNPWNPRDWRAIDGFAWAPNSRSVMILNTSEHFAKDPLGLIAGIFGNPIPHNSVFLDVIDVRTGNVTEYLVRKNVKYAFTRILRWSE
jgi:hypothetical protein